MSGKPITFGRYQKVEAILEADRAIKAKLGAKTEIVCRPPPSNEKAYFCKPVVYITEALHASGADAHTTSKTDVLKLALKLMQDGDGQFKLPDTVRAVDNKAAEPTQITKSKKVKAEKSKPVIVPKPVIAPKPIAKKVSGLARAIPGPAKKLEPKKEGKTSPKDDLALSRSQPEASERALKALMDPSFPLAYGVSLVTLLMTVDQIAETHDRAPGRKERQQKIADLIREFQALTVIPKSAKESTTSPE